MGFRVNGHPGRMQDPTESKVVAGIVGSRVLWAICINVFRLSFLLLVENGKARRACVIVDGIHCIGPRAWCIGARV